MSATDKIFDGLLVLQYRAGKTDALGLLVSRHHKKLCRQAYWYTHDMDAAKDVAQDCWGAILIKLHTLRNPNLFGSWALRIVTRKSLDYVKKMKRELQERTEFTRTNGTNGEGDLQEEQLEKLGKAVLELSPQQQQVLHLFYKEDYSLREISGILEISEGTVKSRLFHAREKLKIMLK